MILDVYNYDVYMDHNGNLFLLLGKADAPEGDSECWCYMFNEGEVVWTETYPRDIPAYQWLGYL